MGLWNRNRFTDIKNILVDARKWGRVGGGWIGSLELATYRMDKQQGPTDSTGNYIQYAVINHNEKEYI